MYRIRYFFRASLWSSVMDMGEMDRAWNPSNSLPRLLSSSASEGTAVSNAASVLLSGEEWYCSHCGVDPDAGVGLVALN
jgi:hypothetical protein